MPSPLLILLAPLCSIVGMLGAPAVAPQEREGSDVVEVPEVSASGDDGASMFDMDALGAADAPAPGSSEETPASPPGPAGSGGAPPMPEVEDLNATREAEAAAQGSGGAPPALEVSEEKGGGPIVLGGGAGSDPIGGGGAGFFDPGRLGGVDGALIHEPT